MRAAWKSLASAALLAAARVRPSARAPSRVRIFAVLREPWPDGRRGVPGRQLGSRAGRAGSGGAAEAVADRLAQAVAGDRHDGNARGAAAVEFPKHREEVAGGLARVG